MKIQKYNNIINMNKHIYRNHDILAARKPKKKPAGLFKFRLPVDIHAH